MADAQANIGIGVDISDALAQIRQLQREISAFHTSMAKGGALANAESARLSQNLINTINAGGKFSAGMTQISSSTESFTNALEKNKLSMTQYFRYAGGASRSFGKMFSREFNTINRVATERVKDLQTQYISMGRDANGALQSIKVRPLALDMNDLGTKVQMVAQKQQIFNQLLKQGSTNLLNFGKNTQWAGRQLMVGFTIPLTIFGATAAREFQKLEEQAVKFRRVYGDMFTTDAETEKALSNIRELADEFTKYGIAVEKTVGLAAKVAQMGNMGADLTAQVTQATRLAVLGGLEQEEALDTTISLTNAFGVAAEDLAGKIAFLNAAENQTILAIEDFNEAIPKAGSVVQQLGGDVEDLAFMLTAMREGGINASQAANAIKSSLGRMINPTVAAQNKLKSFGIDIMGIVENNAGNLQATIMELGYALDNLDPLERARAIETLFGKFQFARMSTMFQNIVKDGSQANKVLGLTANSTEELAIIAERELKRVEESVGFKFQKQIEKLQAALAPIGGEFLKAITPVVEFGTKLLKAFNNLGDGGKQFIVILTAIAGVIAPAALMAFGLIANGVANLIKFFALLGRGFGMLSGQSKILGTGTEYMTQQQIEAAAVAASLGQSHSNLIQVFSAEAVAVNNLANAYRQAIIAQGAFKGTGAAAAGTIPKPRGYASGGLVVGPGTGTSDSIIARVSNKEFIVNAEAAQKNLPLLEALNSGKISLEDIPGFVLGGQVSLGDRSIPIANTSVSTTKAAERFERASQSVPGLGPAVGAAFEDATFSAASFGRALDKAGPALTSVIQLLQTTADVMPTTPADTGAIASHGTAPRQLSVREAEELANNMPAASAGRLRLEEGVARAKAEGSDWAGNLYSEQVFTESAAANKNLLTGSERAAEWRADPLRTGAAMNESGFIDLSDPAQAAEYEQFSELVATKLDAAGSGAVDDTMFQQIIADSVSEMLERGASAGAVEGISEAGNTFRTVKNAAGETPKERKRRKSFGKGNQIVDDGQGGLVVETGVEGSTSNYQVHTAKVRERYSQELDAQTKEIAKNRMAEIAPTVQQDAIDDANIRNDALEQHAKDPYVASTENTRNSPHPDAFPDGADDAKDYLRGQDSVLGTQADPYAGSNLAAPKPPEVGYMPDDNSIRGRLRGLGQRAADKFNDSKIGQEVGKKFSDMTGTPLADSQGNLVYDPDAAIASGAPMPVRIVEGFEMDPEFQRRMEESTARTEDLADRVSENTGTVDRNSEEQKEINKQNKRQNRQALAGKMMAGLGGITMAAGMATQVEGVVGETAQALVGPLAGITAILPMLTAMGPLWGTLLAVIGSGVALWMRHNKAVSDARKEAYELARAMGTGKDAIQKFADFSGRVTSGEIAAQRRQNRQSPLQLQPGQKTFGSAFVGDEAGQALVENTRVALQKLGQDSTIQSLYTQLGTAVTQGALSTEEAISIAAALSQELGDYSIGMQVNAKLIELLGPNGENVLTEPLKIETQAKLMEDSLEASADTLTRSFQQIEMLSGPLVSEGNYQSQYVGSGNNPPNMVVTDPVGQALVEAEYQKRLAEIDANSTGISNWWQKQTLWFDKNTGLIADQLRAEGIGTSMGIFGNNLELASQAIDAQRLSSQAMIDEAIKEGATSAEIAELKQQEADAIDALMESFATANEQLFQWWNSLPETDRITARKDQEDRIVAAAEEKGLSGTQVRADLVQLQSKTNDQEEMRVNMVIRTAVESGALDESQLAAIVDNFNNPEEKDIISDLILGVGPGETGNLINFLKQIDNEELQSDILLGFKDADTETSLERISDLDNLFRTSPIFDGVDIPINFFTTGGGDLEKTLNVADEIRELAAQGKLFDEGQIDLGAYADIVGQDVAERASAAADAIGEEFDALDDAGKLEFFTNFAINAQFTGDPAAIAFYKSKAQEMGLQLDFGTAGSKKEQVAADRTLGEQTMKYIAQTRRVPPPGTDEGVDDGAGGGGGQESLDDLLVGLRNVRQATIDMKRGWDGMQESLQKFLDSGATGFNGLANQMRRLGVGEGLIERITGMDPDEYEKRKAELFVFDEAGNIIGTTQKLQNMAAAMNKLALGEYVNQQQSFIENTKNQFTAMQMLTAQGLSFVEAYEMVQDQALATAIAMGATREEIEELIRITERMTEMQEKYNRLSEKEQAVKAVKETNKEFNKRVQILQKLSKEKGTRSDEEIDAILNDSNLATLYLNPKLDPKTLKQALENARRKADLELQIKVATEEGKKGLFNELVAEVQDEFNRQEAKIDIDFRLATKNDQNIVNEAQNQIAAIQYQIDDYEAQLKGIEDQEEVINEKYDDRYKALEEVAAANERIQRIRTAELDIADALSRGDVAAAARAQQELRAAEAQNRAESQKEMLQRQQEAELARVRSESGMSREQIENKMKALQDEIFGIEESQLEPAQERIRIAEYNKQLQIDALDVSGKTRDEWDQIANLTDIATQNTEEFAKSVERALALYEYFVNGAMLDLDLFGGDLEALKELGVDVEKEKTLAAALDLANRAGSEVQGSDEELTQLQKDALAIQQLSAEITESRKKLANKETAQAESRRLAEAVGAVGSDGKVSGSADQIERRIQAYQQEQLRKLQQQTADFAKKVGGSPDRIDQAYYRAIDSAGGKTAVGAPQTITQQNPPASYTPPPKQGPKGRTIPSQKVTVVSPGQPKPSTGRVIVNNSKLTNAQFAAEVRRDDIMASRGRGSAMGGLIKKYSMGGFVPSYFAAGGKSLGSDTIRAMLTPGEFVIKRPAVNKFGVENLEKINNGTYSGGSVYNYNLAVNVKSNADPERIARTVIKQIQRVDGQRVRGNRL